MKGHLFVVQGDLTRFHCDAWLMSCGPRMRGSGFRTGLPDEARKRLDAGLPRPDGWSTTVRAVPFPDWTDPGPTPVVTDVVHDPGFVGVRQFVEVARGLERRTKRELPLFALPVIGTGGGGASREKGRVLRDLVPYLRDLARSQGVDLALVTHDPVMFAAAQLARRGTSWEGLTEEELRLTEDLAGHARRGHLALFTGAGLSAGVGLPTWTELLEELAVKVGMNREEWKDYGPLDWATLLEKRLKDKGLSLPDEVVKRLKAPRRGLGHLLLAGLPVREAVTLNYDTLFEDACRDAGRPTSVLTSHPSDRTDRWLLKLHGCLSKPKEIVLRREDYLRFEDRRKALAGVVQGLLLTRHLLFVGFSLGDDNFHRIADAVSKASMEGCFGTALMTSSRGTLQELWEPRVRIALLGERAYRRLEQFLDRLVHLTASTGRHLLDPAFDALLDESDRRLQALLERLVRDADAEVRASDAWPAVQEMLRSLGGA